MDGLARGRRVQVFFGETDHVKHRPLQDLLLEYLRREGAAGATVTRGVAGFGMGSVIKTSALLRLSVDLPTVLTWVDAPERVERLLPGLLEIAGSGIVTVEDVGIASYGRRQIEELRFDLLVRDVMVRSVVSVPESLSVTDAVRRLLDREFRALPVIGSDGRLAGILSNEDLLARGGLPARIELLAAMAFVERERLLDTVPDQPVSAVMRRDPTVLHGDERVEVAARRMSERRLKRLPVVDAAGHLVGILSRADVLRAVAESFPADVEHAEGHPGAKTIGELMHRNAPVVRADAALPDVVAAVASTRLNRAIVVDADRRVIGIVTDADVLASSEPGARSGVLGALMRAGGRAAGPTVASDLVHGTVPTVGQEAMLAEAARVMVVHRRKILPVVDGDGRLLGSLDRADLLRAVSDALAELGTASVEDDEE
jgi:CBS domain-containing protein